jgi:ABC-type Zn uptake system ZnuABC Zn-binding protein ZnuA
LINAIQYPIQQQPCHEKEKNIVATAAAPTADIATEATKNTVVVTAIVPIEAATTTVSTE